MKVLTESGQGGSCANVWVFVHGEWLIETDEFVHCGEMS